MTLRVQLVVERRCNNNAENKTFRFILWHWLSGFAYAAQQVWGKDHEIVAFCEIDKFCQKVLKKHWPDVPICEDIGSFDGKELQGTVDLLTGGFPCQDLSSAGQLQGLSGARSGLWREMYRIIGEIRPQYIIIENVSNLLRGDGGRWFSRLLCDLAEVGYDAEWYSLPASSIGAPHHRDRLWIVAYPYKVGRLQPIVEMYIESQRNVGNNYWIERIAGKQTSWVDWKAAIETKEPMDGQPAVVRVDDGLPYGLDRTAALGNAIVPQVAQVIMQAIKEVDCKVVKVRPSSGR